MVVRCLSQSPAIIGGTVFEIPSSTPPPVALAFLQVAPSRKSQSPGSCKTSIPRHFPCKTCHAPVFTWVTTKPSRERAIHKWYLTWMQISPLARCFRLLRYHLSLFSSFRTPTSQPSWHANNDKQSGSALIPCLGSSDDVRGPWAKSATRATEPRSRLAHPLRIAHNSLRVVRRTVRTIPDTLGDPLASIYGSVRSVGAPIPIPPAPELSDTHIIGEVRVVRYPNWYIGCICMGIFGEGVFKTTHLLSTS